jgi:Fur family peroxide stress response transcriptional regulator
MNSSTQAGDLRTPYDEAISRKGLRFTEQRRHVYDSLLDQRDHPTAVEVFMRVKEKMPTISLATVYNCLETLTDCGLVKHIGTERGPARFCPNLEEHAHFFCEQCHAVLDIPLKGEESLPSAWQFPRHTLVTRHEATFHGLCPTCAKDQKIAKTKPAPQTSKRKHTNH